MFGNEHYVIFNEIIDFIHGDNDIVTSLLRPIQTEDGYEVFLNANNVIFEPYGENLNFCSRCLLPKSEHLLETICITNGCDEIQHISTQNNQTALVYFNERLRIWSESVARPVANQMKCQEFSVLKNTLLKTLKS